MTGLPQLPVVRLGDRKVLDHIAAVRKAFTTMAQVTEATRGALQIIVLDHAPADVWGNIPGIEAFEEWRDGKKLVPIEWLTPNSDGKP